MIINKKHNTIVAGPCSAESFSQVDSIASKIHKNIDFFRAGVWKPRTNINSFQGVGEVGLSWLKQIKDKYNIKVACEVANSKHVELCKKFKIDMVWLGARTTVNPFYVQEIAESLQDSKIHVYIKNPIIPDMDLWYNAIKRMQSYNIKNIGAKILFEDKTVLIIEFSGTPTEISSLIKKMKVYNIVELTRSGLVSMALGKDYIRR